MSKFGVQKTRQRPPPVNYTYSLNLRTSTVPDRKLLPAKWRGAPDDGVCKGVGCPRRQSSAASQKRVARYFCVLKYEREAPNACKPLKYIISREGTQHNGYITDEETASIKVLLFFRRMIYLFSSLHRRCCWRKTYVTMMGTKLLGPNKGHKGLKSLGFLYTSITYSTTTKSGPWLPNPCSISTVYVCVAETPARGYLTTHFCGC